MQSLDGGNIGKLRKIAGPSLPLEPRFELNPIEGQYRRPRREGRSVIDGDMFEHFRAKDLLDDGVVRAQRLDGAVEHRIPVNCKRAPSRPVDRTNEVALEAGELRLQGERPRQAQARHAGVRA